MRKLFIAGIFCACATITFAQVGEISVSGGVSRFGDATLVTNPDVSFGDGFRMAFRFTLNTYRFFGHEFGYGYAHSSLKIPGSLFTPVPGQPVPTDQSIGLPVHSGFYDF